MSKEQFEFPKYPCEEDVWDALAKEKRPIVVYGMGNGADKLIRRFERYGICIADFFASDGFVRGHSFHGKRVKSFSEIKGEYPDFVIVLSFGSNRAEVIDMLSRIDREYTMYVPDMPVVGEEYFDREFYNRNYKKLTAAYELFGDEHSRELYRAVINYRISGKLRYILDLCTAPEQIYSLIRSAKRVRASVDAGAYNGDTVREALEFFEDIEKIYAFEPDARSYKKLAALASELPEGRVVPVNAAVYSESRDGVINASGNRNSSLTSASYEHKAKPVSLVRIDEAVSGRVDYVKYDVEGAELDALIGSEGLISECSPALLVSLYHKSEDIFSLPLYLSEKYQDYSFYLRRLRSIPAWELDLIMLPVDKAGRL